MNKPISIFLLIKYLSKKTWYFNEGIDNLLFLKIYLFFYKQDDSNL